MGLQKNSDVVIMPHVAFLIQIHPGSRQSLTTASDGRLVIRLRNPPRFHGFVCVGVQQTGLRKRTSCTLLCGGCISPASLLSARKSGPSPGGASSSELLLRQLLAKLPHVCIHVIQLSGLLHIVQFDPFRREVDVVVPRTATLADAAKERQTCLERKPQWGSLASWGGTQLLDSA